MSKLLRFSHLQQDNIVMSWPQLKRLQDEHDFPPGRLLGDNTRVWTQEEINAWIDSRPVTTPANEQMRERERTNAIAKHAAGTIKKGVRKPKRTKKDRREDAAA